ncbi:MAG TPA: replicative DNA helicase [Pirellulales bacterium]|jgi:replicative DNA helicase|nr:replicative DNA helicase [Pirellulales bacterium]
MSRATDPVLDRPPPHNDEAEANVLGSMILSPAACDDVALVLRPEDFFGHANQTIYRCLLGLHADGIRVDRSLLVERLKHDGMFEAIGGLRYLAEVAEAVPVASNAMHYAEKVRNDARLRRVIEATSDTLSQAHSGGDADEVIASAERRLHDVAERESSVELVSLDDAVLDALAAIDDRSANPARAGLSTGFAGLDGMLGGFRQGEFNVLAARPGMGKTALALNIADRIATAGGVVLFVSLEMSRLELSERWLSARSSVNGESIRSGRLTENTRRAIVSAAGSVPQGRLWIIDPPRAGLTEIAANARRLGRRHGLALVVIDYLQLIEPDNPRDTREQQVSKIARRLKQLARQLKVPVLCLAQLNREAEKSSGYVPRLSHLRESGAIEQDADVVMFVHRPEVYEPDDLDLRGKAELIVAKARNAATGKLDLRWESWATRFSEWPEQGVFT